MLLLGGSPHTDERVFLNSDAVVGGGVVNVAVAVAVVVVVAVVAEFVAVVAVAV